MIVSTVVFDTWSENYPEFFDIFLEKKTKTHLWNKLKLYMKAPNLTQIFSAIN